MNERQMWLLAVGQRVTTSEKAGLIAARTHDAVLIKWDDGIENGWVPMEWGDDIEKTDEPAYITEAPSAAEAWGDEADINYHDDAPVWAEGEAA